MNLLLDYVKNNKNYWGKLNDLIYTDTTHAGVYTYTSLYIYLHNLWWEENMRP
jgi:hypothetical protein